ncbi:hypothetical protein, partial [Micromonospora chokoriensis]
AGQPGRTRLGPPDRGHAVTSSPTPAPVAPGGIVVPSARSRRQGSTPDAGWDGRAAVEAGGSWPALPDERAWPDHRHPDHRRPDQHVGRPGGWHGSDITTLGGALDAAPRDQGGGRWPVSTSLRSPEIGDPWPALPDDGAVWTVPGDTLDAAHLGRLDREQAGD